MSRAWQAILPFAASFFAQLTAADKGSPPLGKRENFRYGLLVLR